MILYIIEVIGTVNGIANVALLGSLLAFIFWKLTRLWTYVIWLSLACVVFIPSRQVLESVLL